MKIGIFVLLTDAFYTFGSHIWTVLGILSSLNKNNYFWQFNAKLKCNVKNIPSCFLFIIKILSLCCDIDVDELFLAIVIMLI